MYLPSSLEGKLEISLFKSWSMSGQSCAEGVAFHVGLSQGGGVACWASILDHHRVPKLFVTWTRRSKTSHTWEADLGFIVCVGREVQFGVSHCVRVTEG